MHRYIRYYKDQDIFIPLHYISRTSSKTLHTHLSEGLSAEEISERQRLYGNCLIDVKIPSITTLLFDGVIHPFFLFQIFSCVL